MAVMGLVLFSTMALASPYLQNVIGYPIITAGLLLASRGCGTFVAMMMVGRLMRYFEARTLIICGLGLTALLAVPHDRLDRPDRRAGDRHRQRHRRALASASSSCRSRRWRS